MSLVAAKLAAGDCSGFHVSGLGLFVPSCPITVRAVLSKGCFCKPCGLSVSQGSEVGEVAKKKKKKCSWEGRGKKGEKAMVEGKGKIENPVPCLF